MASQRHRLWIVALILSTAAGCAFKVEKGASALSADTPTAPAPAAVQATGKILGFNSLKERVLAPRCLKCHSDQGGNKGHVNLESYANAVAVLDKIKNEVLIEKSMPPRKPLGGDEQAIIREWIDADAPLDDVDRPPRKVLWDEVNARIFTPQCLRCHDLNSGKPKAHVDVNTYEDVVKFLKRIQNEALVEHSMPPRTPLSADDQALLQAWIEEGAPQ